MKKNLKDKKQLHIVMIGHKRVPSREGGIEVVVEELATRFVRMGHKVDVYNRYGYHVSGKDYSTNGVKGLYEGIKIVTIPTFRNKSLNAIVYSFLATIRALFSNVDVYHFHAEGPCAFLWMVKLFHPNKKLVVTIHGLDWQRAKWGGFATKVLQYGERQAAKHADEIIVLSENVQQYFKDTYDRDTKYVPNGIELPKKIDAQIIAEKYGLKKDEYILFLARIVPEKGLHYLVEAYEALDTNIKLVIAGGSSHSWEYYEHIQEMIAENDKIIMTGFIEGQILEELYSNAYAFVLPSDVEGMAMSLLEAMSYGNACIVSNIPENLEVVGNSALTFEKGNVNDLKAKLDYMLKNVAVRDGYRRATAALMSQKDDWDQVAEKTMEIYRS